MRANLVNISGGGRTTNRCHFGDAMDVLPQLAAAGLKAQTCVTSPPYFGLRDYGTGTWEGGDDPGCDHSRQLGGTNRSTLDRYENGLNAATIADKVTRYGRASYRDECGNCGARRVDQQIGLEATPQEYVDKLVAVFRLVRDVLADDGTLWLNLGDSYASGGRKTRDADTKLPRRGMNTRPADPDGVKPKDLLGVPWMVAFALRADGWYLRQDLIWSKPNPMPESVTDRCTKAHEYLFLLSKAPRYYFDHEGVKERATTAGCIPGGNKKVDASRNDAGRDMAIPVADVRNRRSVWIVPSMPFSGAHFAVFPQRLIEPCILAGSRPGDVVLDPFFGSGTTGEVAQRLGRQWVGVEIQREYGALQAERVRQQGLAL